VDWIHLAQDKNEWRALVNTVMTLSIHERGARELLEQLSNYWFHKKDSAILS
jgi:hypothetical protein